MGRRSLETSRAPSTQRRDKTVRLGQKRRVSARVWRWETVAADTSAWGAGSGRPCSSSPPQRVFTAAPAKATLPPNPFFPGTRLWVRERHGRAQPQSPSPTVAGGGGATPGRRGSHQPSVNAAAVARRWGHASRQWHLRWLAASNGTSRGWPPMEARSPLNLTRSVRQRRRRIQMQRTLLAAERMLPPGGTLAPSGAVGVLPLRPQDAGRRRTASLRCVPAAQRKGTVTACPHCQGSRQCAPASWRLAENTRAARQKRRHEPTRNDQAIEKSADTEETYVCKFVGLDAPALARSGPWSRPHPLGVRSISGCFRPGKDASGHPSVAATHPRRSPIEGGATHFWRPRRSSDTALAPARQCASRRGAL